MHRMNMQANARTRRLMNRMGVFLILLVTALEVRAEPPSKLPGRKPDSEEPWGAFLGRAAHEAIGKQYVVQHPGHIVFLNTISLQFIIERAELGDPERLSAFTKLLRPDITDTTDHLLFEIKPDTQTSQREGREQVANYLTALNAVAEPHRQFSGGTAYEGSLFIEFENGGALWELSWRTPEPGVTLYRWSYRRQNSQASWKERVAQKEEPLPQQEIARYGKLAEETLHAAYAKNPLPDAFEGTVYLPVPCRR